MDNTIGGIYGAVEGFVGREQVGGHGERVVEVGQGCAGVSGASIEHILSRSFYRRNLCGVGILWPGKIVIHNVFGIVIV
jgi:hypothetical protein